MKTSLNEKIETCCEIADSFLRSYYTKPIDHKVNNEIRYTDDAQNEFNRLYDELMTQIEFIDIEDLTSFDCEKENDFQSYCIKHNNTYVKIKPPASIGMAYHIDTEVYIYLFENLKYN